MAKPAYTVGPHSKPAELLAALGEALYTYQDHDYLYIHQHRQLVRHTTAGRDYCCECGGRLVTVRQGGEWRTVCYENRQHPQGGFIRKTTYQARQQRKRLQAAG